MAREKTTSEIRQEFLSFFESHGHRRVASSSLIPGNDPTILFTNAGMNQFKDVFLGLEKRDYARATTAQKCLRAGGKHNDLENVGFTARHHTFFEMLGNFSFGDYFKKDAIAFAWDFVRNHLSISQDNLYVTVHISDDEAEELWKKQGVKPERIFRFDKDNFWQMADTGPCGPCTEIFFDRAPEKGLANSQQFEQNDGERFMEIWNLVFMQFDQQADGTRLNLPKPSVDTGMGLERVASVLQGKKSNYEIDLFAAIRVALQELISDPGLNYGVSPQVTASYHVIMDHLRACSFLIADGIIPSNEGRGYVLRRILRRAIRFGRLLGKREPFIYKLVPRLSELMGEAYPELNRVEEISRVMRIEEERFLETLEKGLGLLGTKIGELERRGEKTLDGGFAFKLYDTFGFPLDLTQLICREKSVSVDVEGFDSLLEEQRTQSRAAGKRAGAASTTKLQESVLKEKKLIDASQQFLGYAGTKSEGTVQFIFRIEGDRFLPVTSLSTGEKGAVFTDKTPFYAEGGGQVGDTGFLRFGPSSLRVVDTQKGNATHHAHFVEWPSGAGKQVLKVGDRVEMEVDEESRRATAHNHSATHLLHASLRSVLGNHVKQSGSKVDPHGLRFDFSHFAAVTKEELRKIQDLANQWASEAHPVAAVEMTYNDALTKGALALFDEKYGDRVRTIQMGGASFELCGGTHVGNTKECYPVVITSESSVAAGVRRIEAKAGLSAERWLARQREELKDWAVAFNTEPSKLRGRVSEMKMKLSSISQEMEAIEGRLLGAIAGQLLSKAKKVKNISVITAKLSGLTPERWKTVSDDIRSKLTPSVIVLFGEHAGKAHILASATAKDPALKNVSSGELIRILAPLVGGRGGGRPDMAQAGGPDSKGLAQVESTALAWIEKQLG
jgi:alanyl-tRNA synthetase